MILGCGGIRRYKFEARRVTSRLLAFERTVTAANVQAAGDGTSAIDDQREVIDHRGHAIGFAREGEGTVALGA
jgi:hypothetical protein